VEEVEEDPEAMIETIDVGEVEAAQDLRAPDQAHLLAVVAEKEAADITMTEMEVVITEEKKEEDQDQDQILAENTDLIALIEVRVAMATRRTIEETAEVSLLREVM
jgi:hypothetical protein